MSRESCINHASKQVMAIIRQDYYLLMQKDTTAAALLSLFEYWANGEISRNPEAVDPWLGVRSIKEFETMLLGIATDKQIRLRLQVLKERGYIEVKQETSRGSIKNMAYRFVISKVQAAVDALNWQQAKDGDRSLAIPEAVKQERRSNNRRDDDGQTTDVTTVKQPTHDGQITDARRSNNRTTIYKKNTEEDKETREKTHTREVSDPPVEVETPPTEDPEVVTAEIVTEEPPQDRKPAQQESNTNVLTVHKNSSNGSNHLADDNDNPKQYSASVLNFMQVWETKGILPRNAIEINQWAMEEIGEYIRAYRKSGNIMNPSASDIDQDFILFVARDWGKDKDVDAAIAKIHRLEHNKTNWTPRDWASLKALVVKWLAARGTGKKVNLAEVYEEATKPLSRYEQHIRDKAQKQGFKF